MKEGIHPQYEEVTVHCGCGATWKTRSTKKDMHLDICSNCHPFFTGRQKLLDTEGRVERFTKKFGTQTAEQRKTAAKAAKATKATKTKSAKKTSYETSPPCSRAAIRPLRRTAILRSIRRSRYSACSRRRAAVSSASTSSTNVRAVCRSRERCS